MFKDDEKWPIPERFRASADLSDEAAFALLQKNDAEQKALSEQIQSPFTRSSPRDVYRRKAKITVEALLKAQIIQKLTDDQIEQLAEGYATLGRYDLAADTTNLNKKHYEAIWQAVFLPDSEWCAHGDARMFVSEYVWSIKEHQEMPLLKCNICGTMNVLDKPTGLAGREQVAATHHGKTTGMTIQQAMNYHANNVRKNG